MERRTTRGNRAGRDAQGQEILLSSLGQQVMMEWEKKYMERCVDALGVRTTDRVLEIGFGLAYSATRIQRFAPAQHTVVECDRAVLEHAQKFMEGRPGVQIVDGTWQEMLPMLGQFDCIFFDDYPLPELMQDPHSALQTTEASVLRSTRPRSRWYDFLDVALRHCAPGARISGYLAREVDFRRPGCQVSMESMPVETPENCKYFPHKTALVPVITVVDPVAAAGGGFKTDARSQPTLPLASKRFRRAFEKAAGQSHAQIGPFSEQHRKIADIQEFLLTHEMNTLTHGMPDGERVNLDASANRRGITGSSDASYDFATEGAQSTHYKDECSRREFLRSLRSRAASSKQMTDCNQHVST